jgi:hypothetical protein
MRTAARMLYDIILEWRERHANSRETLKVSNNLNNKTYDNLLKSKQDLL